MPSKRTFACLCFLVLAGVMGAATSVAHAQSEANCDRRIGAADDATSSVVHPNIVLFLVDDLGWQDTSVPFHETRTPFNDRYRTPAMERLARQGLVFTNAYAASPVCTPTRTSIMTGLHPARTRITNWTLRNDRDAQETGPAEYPLRSPAWRVTGLLPSDLTLARILGAHGYRTIHVGKAHFGALGTPAENPLNIGFHVNIAGHAAGGPGSYYGSHQFSAAHRGGARLWDVPGLEKYHATEVNLTDALTREACAAIAESVSDGQPFFLNLAHYAVHAPIMADSRFVENDTSLDQIEAAYASMIEATDDSLSRLLADLESLGIAERTLILFVSDNGGLSAHSRGRTPLGTGLNTHNLPLRSGKGSAYEGGVRVPMIVAWAKPGHGSQPQQSLQIAAGTRTDALVTSHDFFPSILQISGAALPAGHQLDGISFVPVLRGRERPARDALFWHYPHKWGPEGPGLDPFTAVREGEWKLIYFYRQRRWELYNLARDLSETTDLAWKQPQVAARLARRMQTWMRTVNAQTPHQRSTDEPVEFPAL